MIVSGILSNILNPELTIVYFTFLTRFVTSDEPDALPRMIELSAVFMLLTLVVVAIYGVFASAVRSHVLSRPRVMTWLRCAFAGWFVALGVRLAVTQR